jgi:hypothetical protein
MEAGELERAADAFAESLRRGELNPEQVRKARAELTRLRRKLGWAEVRGEAGTTVSLGYHQHVKVPLVTHLAAGDHILRGQRADGTQWAQLITISSDTPLSVYAKPTPPAKKEPAPPPKSEGRNTQKKWAITTITMGTALGLTAAFLGVATLDANKKYDEGGNTDATELNQVRQLKLSTNVAAFSAALSGGVGLVLLFTLPNESSKDAGATRLTHLAVGPGRVGLRGTF